MSYITLHISARIFSVRCQISFVSSITVLSRGLCIIYPSRAGENKIITLLSVDAGYIDMALNILETSLLKLGMSILKACAKKKAERSANDFSLGGGGAASNCAVSCGIPGRSREEINVAKTCYLVNKRTRQ